MNKVSCGTAPAAHMVPTARRLPLPFTREGTGLGPCTRYPKLLDMSPVMAESARHTTSAGLRSTAVTVTLAVIVSTIY